MSMPSSIPTHLATPATARNVICNNRPASLILLSSILALSFAMGCGHTVSNDEFQADSDVAQSGDSDIGDGFPKDPEEFEWVCTPTITFRNLTADGNGKLFDELIPDPELFMHEVTSGVCALLYRTPEEVPIKTRIRLTIDDFDGVAGTANGDSTSFIELSSSYLQSYTGSKEELRQEIYGVMFHEVCHVYQRSEDYNSNWGAIEGVADAVRFYAGYIDMAERTPGGSWDSGYKTTAFFLVWLEEHYDWFLHDFNQSFDPDDDRPWSWAVLEELTGKSAAELWAEYQADISG